MFTTIRKFGNRLNGHVLGRDFAIEALIADLISESIALHNAYSPLLLAHQLHADYKSCFSTLFTASFGNVVAGILISIYEPFGYYRLIGAVIAGIGVYLCFKMIATYPRMDDVLLSSNTQDNKQRVEGVSF